MTTKLKIVVGERWGILSVGRVQLEFNLGTAGGKNHQCLRSTLSQWLHLATISFLLLSVVLGSAREMCVFSIRQRWQILTLLRYDGARLRMVRCTSWWCQRHPQCSCRQGWWSCTSLPAGRVATYSCNPWSPCW